MYTKAATGCFLFLTTITYVAADVSHLAGGNASPGFKHSSGGDIPVVDDLSTRSFNQQNWNIRNNIPGEPDVDYPIYSVPPISSFSCKGRHYGYYADVESRCQVFRVCATTDLTGKGFAFLCPNGTLFNQKFFVCDWYQNVDCFASESFFTRNEMFGTTMGSMSTNDMMSMVQVMVDYTKQPQLNNQNVNNNGGFSFTNSQFPKQLGNTQGVVDHNNGLTAFGNSNNQHASGVSNQGHSNGNPQIPQRGSDILSQPILPSENIRFTTPSRTHGESGNAVPNTASGSAPSARNQNFNFNNGGAVNNENNEQQPTLFVSSLGEISSDPNLRFNPFTTAVVSTRIYDSLPSNVDPISTSIDQVQQFASHGQFNQINDNTQHKTQSNEGSLNAAQFQPSNGLNDRITLQQEINHLSVSASDQPNFSQQSVTDGGNASYKSGTTNSQNSGSNEQPSQSLTAVYTGSGDLLSHTINRYGKAVSPQESNPKGREPSLSALVNSLGETILTPIYSGEGNLLSQTIGQQGLNGKPIDTNPNQGVFSTAEKQGLSVSTPRPSLQTPFYGQQTRVTSPPIASGSTSSNQNVPTVEVVYSGEGNLLSQSIGQKKTTGQSQQSSQLSETTRNSVQSTFFRQSAPTTSSQSVQSQTFAANRLGEQKSGSNQGTFTGSSSVRQTTQSIPSTQGFVQTYQHPSKTITQSNTATQFTSIGQTTTYNNRVSFGQKSSTSPTATGTTTVPYSPSVPPFRSTTTTYTPTATSYNQRTQTYNGQSHNSGSFNQQGNAQQAFSNNQFQLPAKEYLPSVDNTRTARTNEVSLGNYGASTKFSSSQNFAETNQDGRQQFTYPADQTDSKPLDTTNDLPNLGADADPTKQNLINRDVTHIDKYLYRSQIEPAKNESVELTVNTSERNADIRLSSISIADIFDFNRILQEGGKLEDASSEEIVLPSDQREVTANQIQSELSDFKLNPIIVAPIGNSISNDDGASDDIEDSKVLHKFDESANLLFAGLQLSLFEEKELQDGDIQNDLNDDIFRSQDAYEAKVRNPKDVYSSGGGPKQTNSIKLIFERAKNRSNNFRVKLKGHQETENKDKRMFALAPKTAEEKLVTILRPLLRNITMTPRKYLEKNTKIAGFINNDLKSSVGETGQRHSQAPRILFKNVKTIEDIERIATGIETIDTDVEELTSETKLSNRITIPDLLNLHSNTNIDNHRIDSKMTISSIHPLLEIKDIDLAFHTPSISVPQKKPPRPIKDHETASSNQQNYAYPSNYNQQTYSTYNQYNPYPQYQQQEPIHYATIDNRPNPTQSTFQAPPLQSHYPASIQNNPQPHSSYHSTANRYIPPAPSPIPSSIPPSLPSIVHPSPQYPTQQTRTFPSNQLPRTTSNEKVVVKIIPASGWYLNDAKERQSFFDAVSHGLLNEKGFVYVNNVQSSQQKSNLNVQQPQGRSQIDIDEEAYFRGSSSYESPLNSVGKLPGDSDSVSGLFDSATSASSPMSRTGYHYEHPRRSFNV